MATENNLAWSVDLHPVTGESRIISSECTIALVAVGPAEHENATLLAAAPAMREVLRTTRGNVASLGPAGVFAHVHTPYQVWLDAIDAVLAKADGSNANG